VNWKGISVGWFLTFGQVYINEAAPAHLRGIVFAVYQTQLSVGSVIGAAVDYGTHNMQDKNAYRIPLALFFIAPTVQSISLIFFPESPRWLMAHGREESAELALRRLRGRAIEEATFQAELNEIRMSTRQQVEHSKREKKQLWLEIWNKSNRRRTLLSIAVVCFHCAAGGCRPTVFLFRVAVLHHAFQHAD
jgi:MFS family permease